jgi:hypothetical protein
MHLEEAHQEEAPQVEEHQEADLREEDNHRRNKPKPCNQHPNNPDHITNPYEEQKWKNSGETEPMPRNS